MYWCKSVYDDKVARGKNVKNVYGIVSFFIFKYIC